MASDGDYGEAAASEATATAALQAALRALGARLAGHGPELQALHRRVEELARQAALASYVAAMRARQLHNARAALQRARARPDPAAAGEERRMRLVDYPPVDPETAAAIGELLNATRLFDAGWYRSRYPDAAASEECLEHFIAIGLPEDRDPHPLFDTAWYRRQLPPGRLGDTYPLLHFLGEGGRSGISPHPLFDAAWYLAGNPDVAEVGMNPLQHFLLYGVAEGRHPHAAFDLAWYETSRGREAMAGRNPLVDYLEAPEAAAAAPHPLFDGAWYLEQNPDLRAAGDNPLRHFLTRGHAEGRDPHPLFDLDWYREHYPEAAAQNPLIHFLQSRIAEHRRTNPWFDPEWYLERYDDVRRQKILPLVHYLKEGAREGRPPSRGFPAAAAEGGLLRLLGADPALDCDLSPPAQAVPEAAAEALPAHGDYHLPDRLREYLLDRFGEDTAVFVRHLMAIIARHEARPTDFARSEDCRRLVAWLRRAAADPEPTRPVDVSIVLPVYNGLVFSLTCLVSLFATPTRHRFEIVVGDDLSSDGTADVLRAIGGRVRYWRNPENLGFLLNCNVTSRAARGRWLVLLNSDVIVLPGWLDELAGSLAADDRVGCVGAKLLNADGSLQEAGAILWQDGTGWNYGRGEDPRLPEYNYVKEADYCSGAAIALPRMLWEELGGFDLRYLPAYCEDSDLAFRVRAAGKKVVYQPFAEIIHHEGKSHGRELDSGIKSYQIVNTEKLVARWADVFGREHFPPGEHAFLARDRSRGRPHILVVDHYVPQWDRDFGSRTIYLYLKLFAESGFHVVLWPDNLNRDPVYTEALQKLGIEVVYSAAYVGRFAAWIEENGRYLDYVLLSRPHVAIEYVEAVRAHCPGKLLFYGHDLHWYRLVVQHEITSNPGLVADIDRFRALEDRICGECDAIMYPSAEECELLRAKFPKKTVIELPAAYYEEREIAAARQRAAQGAAREPYHLMFVGGFAHPPNADGIVWFVREVFPELCRRDPRFRLTIAGSNPTDEVRALAGPRVAVTGPLSEAELERLYRSAAAAIVPLRFGAGVKGKLLESFAYGIPVVATTVGVQGIDDPEAVAFVADTPDAFAEAVRQAAGEPAAAAARVERALAFLERRYSRARARTALSAIVAEFR